jgi:DNA repair exonuclease SbcCD ATPase subunit
LIDKSLEVTTAEGTITIAIEWDDPQQAYRLVEGALQNFLEVRHLQEITAIDEVISMLQGRAATLRDQLERVIEEVRRQGARDTSRPLHMAESLGPPSEEAVRLKSMLEAKERAIADVEEFRRRRLADLQTQLDAQRAVYSEAHPTIKSLRQDIAALSRESPQISSLREEAEKLRREYGSSLAREGRPGSVAMPPLLRQPTGGPLEENERVRAARFQFQQMAERVSAAQVELDAARSAFKYRYHVVWPPEVPRKPVSPKPGKIFGVGVIASILFALAAAAAPEILSGRVVERWQVERSLDLPVLGEVSEK